MSISNNQINRSSVPVTPDVKPGVTADLTGPGSADTQTKPVPRPEAFRASQGGSTTTSVISGEQVETTEQGLDNVSGSKVRKLSTVVPKPETLLSTSVSVSQESGLTAPPPLAPPLPQIGGISREEFGSDVILGNFQKLGRDLDRCWFNKSKQKVLDKAQARGAEIARNTPPGSDLMKLLVNSSDTELRDMVAKGIALTKKKYEGVGYDGLSRHKQKLVDSIVAGLIEGLPKEYQTLRKLKQQATTDNIPLSQAIEQSTIKPSQETIDTLELSIAGKGIEKIKEKMWFDQESLRTQLMYHDLPVPDPKEVSLETLRGKLDDLRPIDGGLKGRAVTFLQQLPEEQREGMLWTLAMKPFDQTLREVTSMMYPFKMGFGLTESEKSQARQMTLGLVQASLDQLGPGKGNSLLGSDGDDKPTQVTHNGKTYNQVRQLGEGGFGVAFLFRSDDNDEIVVKQFKRDYHTDPFLTPTEVEAAEVEWFGKMQDEIRIHRYAMGQQGEGHENVLGLKGMITRPPTGGERFGELFTITEVAKGGEMRDTMERLHQQLQDKRISKTVGDLLSRQLFAQTIEGMYYVQKERQMLHLDLKPENVFLTSDGTVKVADFGLSHIGHVSDHIGGTPLYMAPEGVEGSGLDLKSDSWTLGVICRELLTGQLGMVKHGQDAPEPTTMNELEDRLQDYTSNTNNRVYRSEQQDDINPTELTNSKGEDVNLQNLGGFHHLVNAMMHPDPTQRPTLEAIRRHEFVSDPMLQMPQLKELISKLTVSTKNMDVNQLTAHNEEIGRLSKEIEQLAKR